MKVTRSVLVPYDAEEMFDVVNDVSSYPSFVPGCMDATVLESTPESMFGRMADEMVDAFIARAEHLYTDEN